MKKLFVSCLILLISMTTFAQTAKTQTSIIQTNGVCGMCEKKFASNVPYFKGVTDFSYDMATSKITVTFNPKKTTIDDIRKGISNLGYDADGVKANAEARAKLPACCRKAGAHDADAKSQTGGCGHTH